MAKSLLFKNLVVYQFTQPFPLSAAELETKLEEKCFNGCGEHDFSSFGWTSALSKNSKNFVHEGNDCLLICATHEEKIIPSSVVADLVEERIAEIEDQQSRTVYSKERRFIRDDIVASLLPRAFSRKKYTQAYIDVTSGLLVVNASSFNQAKELTSFFRQTLGSLPVVSLPVKDVPAFRMTNWLSGDETIPDSYILGDFCELRDYGNLRDEKGVVIARHEDLESDAITEHLASGKAVSKLGIKWKDQLSVRLCDDLRFTQLTFSDEFKEKLDEVESDNHQQELATTFQIMTGTLRRFLTDHKQAFRWGEVA